jgi:hypothetical protein
MTAMTVISRRFIVRVCLTGIGLFVVLWVVGIGGCLLSSHDVTVMQNDPPKELPPPLLADDRVEEKKTEFDADLVDRRPLGDWRVNASEAPVRLDVDTVVREKEAALADLHPSYALAAGAARALIGDLTAGTVVLPSVNVIDGKAKQFDDGLYAALDQAYYSGLDETLQSHVRLVRRMFDAVGPASPAAPFLAAGLELAGQKVELPDAGARAAKDRWLSKFANDPSRSKPIAFYVWNSTLVDCWRFLRFFQKEFAGSDMAVPLAVSHALAGDPALRADYRKALDFYAHLTDPFPCFSFDDLGGQTAVFNPARTTVEHRDTCALFPPSGSRDTELFRKLFPLGLPPDTDMMRELIARIRSGDVDLKPRANGGWYDYQAYALEAFVLPEKAEGANKLVLTRSYKERSLEAFRALLTKRRETHERQMESVGCAKNESDMPELVRPDSVSPRLRVEPCPGYYLRTARAYSFLADYLDATIGEPGLRSLHGLTEAGPRPLDLYTELHFMRDLFYGLYAITAEDIGLKPELTPEELNPSEACYAIAAVWLPKALDDADLSADTRVATPVYFDRLLHRTRLWVTLGVRTAKLDAEYADAARPPRIRPLKPATSNPSPTQPAADPDWSKVESYRLATAHYLIFGDEFAEVEINSLSPPTRKEFRTICDQNKTREAILEALRGWK